MSQTRTLGSLVIGDFQARGSELIRLMTLVNSCLTVSMTRDTSLERFTIERR